MNEQSNHYGIKQYKNNTVYIHELGHVVEIMIILNLPLS